MSDVSFAPGTAVTVGDCLWRADGRKGDVVIATPSAGVNRHRAIFLGGVR